MNLIDIFYFIPLMFSISYFTLMKVEDMNRVEKIFAIHKLSYVQCVGLCFAPVLNIIIATIMVYKVLFR